MEQITKLLVATTLLSIFAYLLIFYSVGYAGNGGEYWGFDGYTDARAAVLDDFEAGEYRFLEVKMQDANGNPAQYVPLVPACENHPFGARSFSRTSSGEAIHGMDSFRLADSFARRYNYSMAGLLEDRLNVRCQAFLGK